MKESGLKNSRGDAFYEIDSVEGGFHVKLTLLEKKKLGAYAMLIYQGWEHLWFFALQPMKYTTLHLT